MMSSQDIQLKYQRVRAAGGHLVHIVPLDGSRRALCGYKPGGTTRMGSGRARWYSTGSAPFERACEKCEKRFEKTGLSLDFVE